MPESFSIDENICRQVLSLKLTADTLESELYKRGIASEHIAEYLHVIKRMRNEKRRSTGFICMAAGAFLGFLSCVLTISHAMPDMYDFIMYGLTSIAVCIVVLGLYYVFE
jgi:hypothetical protein